jgi:hypothetical protein
MMAVACAAPSTTSATITGHLVAGPVCPVETDPPDPACAPRPVPNAEVIAVSSDGIEYRTTSDFDGVFRLSVPAGELNLTFSEVEGMLAVPEPITVTVADQETIDLGEILYDTGIR